MKDKLLTITDNVFYVRQKNKIQIALDYLAAFRARIWFFARRVTPVYIEPKMNLYGVAKVKVNGSNELVFIVRSSKDHKWKIAYEPRWRIIKQKYRTVIFITIFHDLAEAREYLYTWTMNQHGKKYD